MTFVQDELQWITFAVAPASKRLLCVCALCSGIVRAQYNLSNKCTANVTSAPHLIQMIDQFQWNLLDFCLKSNEIHKNIVKSFDANFKDQFKQKKKILFVLCSFTSTHCFSNSLYNVWWNAYWLFGSWNSNSNSKCKCLVKCNRMIWLYWLSFNSFDSCTMKYHFNRWPIQTQLLISCFFTFWFLFFLSLSPFSV